MANERYAEFLEETPKSWIQALFEESSTQKYRLGQRRPLADGREYMYIQAGAANLDPGKLTMARAMVAANEANLALANISAAVVAAGCREITVTVGNTILANTANALAEGYINIVDGTGQGYSYKIKGHPAIAANGTGNLSLYDKVRAALTTAKGTIFMNPAKAVIATAGVPTATLVGVPMFTITANYYAWVQVKGPAAVLANGTLVIGNDCGPGTVAGSVGPLPANTGEVYPRVGRVIAIGTADLDYASIDLRL